MYGTGTVVQLKVLNKKLIPITPLHAAAPKNFHSAFVGIKTHNVIFTSVLQASITIGYHLESRYVYSTVT